MTKILMVVPNISDGTSWVRSAPYLKLEYEIARHPVGKLIDWPELYDIDAAFFQRPANQLDVHNIETCKRMGIPTIVDYDDNGFLVEPHNQAHEFYSRDDKQECMRECMRLADVVTVTQSHLRAKLLEQVPTANIIVVPNAIDDELFSVEPSYHQRNKTIVMRGAGSHEIDWGNYKDAILEIMATHPDYTLAVMGFHPDWLKEVKKIKYYKFTDIPTYFDTLMQLKPEIAIVPLADSEFNRCKSNLAWQEFTVAGATVLASDLHMFRVPGCLTFSNSKDLLQLIDGLISSPEDSQQLYEMSLKTLPKLSEVNEKRKDIVESLKKRKYHPYTLELKPATQLEFHNYTLSHGHTSDDPMYKQAHAECAEYLIKTVEPKTCLEIGCGTGGTLVELLKRGVMAYGIEYNPHAVDYFKETCPMYANQVTLADITKEPIENDVPGDLLISIEVFEHISMPEEWWEEFITKLSKQFRHFYFSSTPYADVEAFDQYWGHINVRRTTEWVALFEKCGWEFIKSPKQLTSWDLLLKSKNVK